MRFLIVLAVVAIAAQSSAQGNSKKDSCPGIKDNLNCSLTSDTSSGYCHMVERDDFTTCQQKKVTDCDSLLAGFAHSQTDLNKYANVQIADSYNFLLLATRFGTFNKNRPGFAKLYKDMSDKAWNNAIDLIKYVTKRGGEMQFNTDEGKKITVAELNEDVSLAYALDTQKKLAMEAHQIHRHASHVRCQNHYDPAVAHFVEEKFFEEQTETVRNLAGYANDLNKLMGSASTKELATYLFDEYLQKQ